MLTAKDTAQQVDEGYVDFEKVVASRLGNAVGPLFTTDAERLWDHYLNSLPSNRQHYNCRCCRNFIERFGGLVSLTATGQMESATWPADVPAFFQEAVTYMRRVVLDSRVTGVFVNSQEQLGVAQSKKGWTHIHAMNPLIFRSPLLNADQRVAEYKEEYGLMRRTLAEYEVHHAEDALKILQSETFKDAEKVVGTAKWFFNLLRDFHSSNNRRWRDRIVWFHVATAPAGFTHLKNGMLGTLLDDLKSGKGFEECRRAWSEKMHPLKYRRPTATPSEGQIEAAERAVEKLGIQQSLRRRFAKLEDLPNVFWRPQAEEPAKQQGGVFGHLRSSPPKATPVALPNQTVTWRKFERDVLPNTRKLEVDVPWHGGFMGMMTAVDKDAPPIIQWDFPEARNPVSYYVYHGGSYASKWKLQTGWREVPLLCFAPHADRLPNHANFVYIPIKGASDQGRAGLALFPVMLKAELAAYAKVIERHSNTGMPEGESEVGGLVIDSKSGGSVQLRVNGLDVYTIDRWE